VHRAVLDDRDVASGRLDSIDVEPHDASIHALRILDDDPVLEASFSSRRAIVALA
jgi:hypothetical protein